MKESEYPSVGDKVKLINCVAARKHRGRIFTIKQSPVIFDRNYAVVLKEIRGYYFIKNIQILGE